MAKAVANHAASAAITAASSVTWFRCSTVSTWAGACLRTVARAKAIRALTCASAIVHGEQRPDRVHIAGSGQPVRGLRDLHRMGGEGEVPPRTAGALPQERHERLLFGLDVAAVRLA